MNVTTWVQVAKGGVWHLLSTSVLPQRWRLTCSWQEVAHDGTARFARSEVVGADGRRKCKRCSALAVREIEWQIEQLRSAGIEVPS